MVDKLTLNYLATALVGIPAVRMPTACSSKLETSVALCCVTKQKILERPLIVPSTRCTCVMIMLFNQLLGKGEMLINSWTTFERNTFFVRMKHFWDLLFQLMKHGTNT